MIWLQTLKDLPKNVNEDHGETRLRTEGGCANASKAQPLRLQGASLER
jgi:hypothetical protein